MFLVSYSDIQSKNILLMSRTLLIFFLLLISFISKGQINNKFERITTDKGLSEGFVNWILKDYKGFIWIGTRDGLNRYDGYNYKIFKNDFNDPSSISNNLVQVLYETRDSVLFIGTHGGLNIYNGKTGTFESFKYIPQDETSLSNNAIYALYEDKYGKIWVGTFGGGVCSFDRKTKKFKRYIHNPKIAGSISGNAIRGIMEDKEGNLWVGVDGAGLNKFDRTNHSFKHYRHDPANSKSLGSDIVLCITPDKNGNFWVGSWASGVSVFDPLKGEAIDFLRHNPLDDNSLASDENFSIAMASTSDTWITTRNGLDKIDGITGNISHNKHDPLIESSINFDVICFVYEDREGILWVGTEGGGASKLDLYKKNFYLFENNYKNINSLSNNDVTSIIQDNEGLYWIGTRGGLNKYNHETNTFTRIYIDQNNTNSLLSNQLQAITEDTQDNLWFGVSDKGLSCYNKKTGIYTNYYTIENDLTSLSNNAIYSILSDRYGYIWVGTYGGGINRFDPKTKTFKQYTIDANNNMQNVALCLFEDSEGTIWAGTMGHGLQKYDRKTDKLIAYESEPTNSNTISSNIVYSINETDEYLWIGTGGGGMDRLNTSSMEFKNYNSTDGLAADQVMSILTDDKNNLWIGTAKGLSKFNIKTEQFRNFDSRDGISSNSFNAGSAFRNRKGEMLFGTKRGFILFHPDSIVDNNIAPQVVLTDLKIFNESVIPSEDAPLNEQITNAKSVDIQYYENNFTFEFAALHFSNPEKNNYKYKMNGYDNDWITTDHTRRYATYTNLPGGEYTFTVLASNNDGVWNNKGVSIQVNIIPPFWKTIWFYSLMFVFMGIVIYILFRFREKQALKEKLRLQAEVDKAVNEVEEQKKEIMQQNSSLQQKQEEEKQRRWFNEGLAIFGDILRNNKDDIHKLGQQILSTLVRYVDAAQAGLFIINDDISNEQYLEQIASYAYDSQHYNRKKIDIGEGLIGNCFKEKKTRIIANIPTDYLQITSALGSSQANVLYLIPLKFDEIVFGVLELSSLKKYSEFEISFLEKLTENITAQLFNTKMAMQTQYLLSQSQKQTQELKEQEEEIRQNIEEMQANQEEMQREKEKVTHQLQVIENSIFRCEISIKGDIIDANQNFLTLFGIKNLKSQPRNIATFFQTDSTDFESLWKDSVKESRPLIGKLKVNDSSAEQIPAVITHPTSQNRKSTIMLLAIKISDQK